MSVRPGGKLRWLVVFSAVLVVPACLTAAADVPGAAAATAMKVSKSPATLGIHDGAINRCDGNGKVPQLPGSPAPRRPAPRSAARCGAGSASPPSGTAPHGTSPIPPRTRPRPRSRHSRSTRNAWRRGSSTPSRDARDHPRGDRVQAGRLLQADRAWDDEEDRVHTEPERLPARGPAVPRHVHLRGPGRPDKVAIKGFPGAANGALGQPMAPVTIIAPWGEPDYGRSVYEIPAAATTTPSTTRPARGGRPRRRAARSLPPTCTTT